MKIKSFTIRNFKNIRFAECEDLPDFLVICGSNGSGKSAILEALMAVKLIAGNRNNTALYKSYVSGYSSQSEISVILEFTAIEIEKTNEGLAPHLQVKDKTHFKANVTILKNGQVNMQFEKDNFTVNALGGNYEGAGVFDYFSAHRQNARTEVTSWNPGSLSAEAIRNTLENGITKFNLVKNYLANLKMTDLQNLQRSQLAGQLQTFDSFKDIRIFFNKIFSPMRFADVYIDRTPFYFEIETPAGPVDIDYLSSGEKEILNTYIHFHQLQTKHSVILIDEPDAHLHPELQKQYLDFLKQIGVGNQLIITTHSPEMMADAGAEALYTVIKFPNKVDENQFARVSGTVELHKALTSVMGSSGFVSLNRKIVFIEGESASTDVEFYSKLFPTSKHNLKFVPAGGSTTVKAISDKIFYLLEKGDGFQEFYCIVDGDIENRHHQTDRLFKLPVYHVENYLLDEENILKVCQMLLSSSFPLENATRVNELLQEIVLSESHIKSYTGSLLDSQVYEQAEKAKNFIFQGRFDELSKISKIRYDVLLPEAKKILEDSIANANWKQKCKGRDVLKEFCRIYQIKYDQFRNALLYNMRRAPEDLESIINQITN